MALSFPEDSLLQWAFCRISLSIFGVFAIMENAANLTLSVHAFIKCTACFISFSISFLHNASRSTLYGTNALGFSGRSANVPNWSSPGMCLRTVPTGLSNWYQLPTASGMLSDAIENMYALHGLSLISACDMRLATMNTLIARCMLNLALECFISRH